jgi:hypothetical protein
MLQPWNTFEPLKQLRKQPSTSSACLGWDRSRPSVKLFRLGLRAGRHRQGVLLSAIGYSSLRRSCCFPIPLFLESLKLRAFLAFLISCQYTSIVEGY